jgi:hypothetical protein
MNKKKHKIKKKMLRNAGRTSGWALRGQLSTVNAVEMRNYRNRGTFGPASEVRSIDPSTYHLPLK